MNKSMTRRDILKNLAVAVPVGTVLEVIPLQAAQHAHHAVKKEKDQAPAGSYTPKFFNERQYQTLRALCQAIIPADAECGGAIEAGAPEFIDLLTSENEEYQARLGGGLIWLDAACQQRYGKAYLEAAAGQQEEILDLISHRASEAADPTLRTGIQFFSFLRQLTVDGFFTSEIGINYVGYVGNEFLDEFPGCPPVPGL
jgi:hypothetical protein